MGLKNLICSVCDEVVDNLQYCDSCDSGYCEKCADIYLTNQGSKVDDIDVICDNCYRERMGI